MKDYKYVIKNISLNEFGIMNLDDYALSENPDNVLMWPGHLMHSSDKLKKVELVKFIIENFIQVHILPMLICQELVQFKKVINNNNSRNKYLILFLK